MESEEIRELRATLLKLKQEHRDLDSAINALEEEKAVPERRDRPYRGPAPAGHHRIEHDPEKLQTFRTRSCVTDKD
jgi:hypothetical protein